MLFVVLCPGTPEGSTSSVSGLLLPMSFWGRMLAYGLNFNTYSFSVTSIFHPCQAIH